MAETRAKWICFAYVSILSLLWLWLSADNWIYGRYFHQLKGVGSFAGVIGYSLFSVSLLLSSRWKKMEDWFGGLDRIYHLHRQVGIWGFAFLLLHPVILAIRSPHHNFFSFFLPVHHRFSVNLGVYAFWIMVILLGITLLKLLPYHLWKWTHKAMSLVFLLASFHFFLSNHLFAPSLELKILLFIPFLVGLASILYKQIFSYFRPSYLYKVVGVRNVNERTIEVSIEPKGEKIHFVPGQYAFFSFKAKNLSSESHPFTLCKNPNREQNAILVKARGDFTETLLHRVKPGDLVELEGPHGRFDYTKEGTSQIWIAGGVGIAPFVCWAESMRDSKQTRWKIDLYYSVHQESDFIDFGNFEKLGGSFRFFPISSAKSGRLSAKYIRDISGGLEGKSIFICGPKQMTQELKSQFMQLGVKSNRILFEDFEFL